MANNLIKVEDYLQDHTLPMFEALSEYLGLANKQFGDWNDGPNRGGSRLVRLPSLFSSSDSLGFTSAADNVQERFFAITADKEAQVWHGFSDQQMATYPVEKIADEFALEQMTELCCGFQSKSITDSYLNRS